MADRPDEADANERLIREFYATEFAYPPDSGCSLRQRSHVVALHGVLAERWVVFDLHGLIALMQTD